jgi:hypothetical protein
MLEIRGNMGQCESKAIDLRIEKKQSFKERL